LARVVERGGSIWGRREELRRALSGHEGGTRPSRKPHRRLGERPSRGVARPAEKLLLAS